MSLNEAFTVKSIATALKMSLRMAVEVPFLKEAALENIQGAKLPTIKMAFLHFWNHYKVLGKKLSVAFRDKAKAMMACWQEAGLRPKKIDCIISDLNKWFASYKVNHHYHIKIKCNIFRCILASP